MECIRITHRVRTLAAHDQLHVRGLQLDIAVGLFDTLSKD